MKKWGGVEEIQGAEFLSMHATLLRTMIIVRAGPVRVVFSESK